MSEELGFEAPQSNSAPSVVNPPIDQNATQGGFNTDDVRAYMNGRAHDMPPIFWRPGASFDEVSGIAARKLSSWVNYGYSRMNSSTSVDRQRRAEQLRNLSAKLYAVAAPLFIQG